MTDFYNEKIFLIKNKNRFDWYVADKDLILSEFYQNHNSTAFIAAIENKKYSTEFLRELFAVVLNDIDDLYDLKNLFPKLWIDFDDNYLSIRLGEDYHSYEEFIPSGWTIDHNENMPNYIPENLACWIIDGKDYFIAFSEP